MSESYSITGRIKVINDTQTFASGFSKREFVVTVPDGKYPQDIKLELLKDRVDDLNGLQQDDEITVHFNIRGSEYNGKYYVNLVAWRIEQENVSPDRQQPQNAAPASQDDDSEPIPF